MIEKLPTPFGLVRGGVAPDRQNIKRVAAVYNGSARSPALAFFGNVRVGEDVSVDELCNLYHAVIFACGAPEDKRLGIPGEELRGVHGATEFVGWYNGHPDHRDHDFDLSQEVVAVLGHGNVAADI